MIRAQSLTGEWRVIGADLYPGIEPEGINPNWGPAGPESFTFTLALPPALVHSELGAFTPIEYREDASTVDDDPDWSGYILQAPPGGRQAKTQVTCVGWHFYRGDAPGNAFFLETDLTRFVDTRGIPGEDLSVNRVHGQVQVGSNQIVLGWAKDEVMATNERVAVVLDLGEGNKAKHVGIVARGGDTTSSLFTLQIVGADVPFCNNLDPVDWEGSSVLTRGVAAAADVPLSVTFTTPRRYIHLIATYTSAQTIGGDLTWTILEASISAKASYVTYDSGAVSWVSALTADEILKVSRDRMTPRLSKDNSRITPVVYGIPTYSWGSERPTNRQVSDGANDYHGYRCGVDEARRVFFVPQPSIPRLQVDADADGVDFRDTSTNDGNEVYNHVVVRAQSGAGEELAIERWLCEYLPAADRPTPVALTNPSFTTDASGWTGLIRTTSSAHSAPGTGFRNSFNVAAVGSFDSGQTFKAGVLYVVRGFIRAGSMGRGSIFSYKMRLGVPGGDEVERIGAAPLGSHFTYLPFALPWMPLEDTPSANVKLSLIPGRGRNSTNELIDTLSVGEANSDVLTARRRKRSYTLTVGVPSDLIAMEELAKSYLLAHRSTPFRANLSIVADDVVEDLVTGTVVPAAKVGRYYGEMVRVLNAPDPDLGKLSRDGIIASVSGTRPASVALDTERRSLEALIKRMQASGGPSR